MVVSVHALARAGLDVRRVSSVSLGTQGAAGSQINLSPLFHLARDDSFIADEEPNQFLSSVQEHSSGLVTFTKARTERTRSEIINGLHENSVVKLNGLTVALGQMRLRNPAFPVVISLTLRQVTNRVRSIPSRLSKVISWNITIA